MVELSRDTLRSTRRVDCGLGSPLPQVGLPLASLKLSRMACLEGKLLALPLPLGGIGQSSALFGRVEEAAGVFAAVCSQLQLFEARASRVARLSD